MNKYYYIVAVTPETKGALYYDKKLSLTGTMPQGFEDAATSDLYLAGFNPTDDPEQDGLSTAQLTAIVDAKLAGTWTGEVIITSRAQGKWLHANHPAFMTEVVE